LCAERNGSPPNGCELLAVVGEVGPDKDSVTPRLATKLVFFQPEGDTVEIVMQVANFHYNRGGITKFIELGDGNRMAFRTNLKIAYEMFIHVLASGLPRVTEGRGFCHTSWLEW